MISLHQGAAEAGKSLELIGSLESREALRLRADVLWAAKRWRELWPKVRFLD